MKKILTTSLLTLGIVLISGCSLTKQKPVDNQALTGQITALQQQISGFISQIEILKNDNEGLIKENEKLRQNNVLANINPNITNLDVTVFDENNISHVVSDDEMSSYFIYKNMKSYKNGSVGVQIGGQDGLGIDLFYHKNGEILKRQNKVLWFDGVTKKLHIYCIEHCDSNGCYKDKRTDGSVGLDQCKSIKTFTTQSCGNDSFCTKGLFEYIYNLINGIEKNDYFSENLDGFLKGL